MSSSPPSLACKYCSEGITVKLIRKGTLYYCPNCETMYAVCDEIRTQLTQAAKKYARNAKALSAPRPTVQISHNADE